MEVFIRIIQETKLDFDDVLLLPKRSTIGSRLEVELCRKFEDKYHNTFEGVPIIASNMATGNFKMLNELVRHKMFTAIAKHHNDQWDTNNIISRQHKLLFGFYTIGIRDKKEKTNLINFQKKLNSEGNTILLKVIVDVANGYMEKFVDFIKELRNDLGEKVVIFAGNVCTAEAAQELMLAGASGIKCGIGPSKFCNTRTVTGVGQPQFSSIIEVADVVHGLDGLVIADGGCKTPGDVCKAFCANADMVMLGTMLAGTDECDGEIITKHHQEGFEQRDAGFYYKYNPIYKEKKYKIFYGMSSDLSRKIVGDEIKDYRASEGYIEEVPYKGSVDIPVRNILGGLRSCGSYIGAKSIKNFGKCATFVKVNRLK